MTNFRKTHNRIKIKNAKPSSATWLNRHLNDVYVQQSKRDGYRSRAAYKLLEIHNKFKIFLNDGPILDLGCAPGSWLQVVKKITPAVKIIGVDLLKIDPVPGVEFICGDLFNEAVQNNIKEFSEKYSVVMSDISPNTTGIKNVDHLRILNIAEAVLTLSQSLLKTNGTMICKVFQGCYEKEFSNKIKKSFADVAHFKPESSRKESNEVYLIAKNFKAR